MPRSEEHQRGCRCLWVRKGFKKISKRLEINPSTVRKSICKWCRFQTPANLSRTGCVSKFSLRVRADSQESNIISQGLQITLPTVNAATIRQRLNKFDLHGDVSEKSICCTKRALKPNYSLPVNMKAGARTFGIMCSGWSYFCWRGQYSLLSVYYLIWHKNIASVQFYLVVQWLKKKFFLEVLIKYSTFYLLPVLWRRSNDCLLKCILYFMFW